MSDETTTDEHAAAEPATVVRRTRRAPFNPPAEQPTQPSGTVVSRNWGLGLRSSTRGKESGLTRNRKIAGDLPDWAPLPPGEISVDRPAGSQR